MCIITDNNAINRKVTSYFMSSPKLQFLYPRPSDKNKPLFFIVDSVHLKCIRNNWLNQKNDEKCFFYPDFHNGFNNNEAHEFKTASLSTLRLLYNIECNSLIKFGFNLTHKSLHQSSLEHQNVSLVLCVFNEFVAQSLVEGKKHILPHFQGIADFITIIS